MVKRLDENFETQIWFPFLQHQHHLGAFQIQDLRSIPDILNQDLHFNKIIRGFLWMLKYENIKGTISLSLQVSWGISTWKNYAARSYIGIILILDFRRGDFCHIGHSPISLILTKHIILNISLSPEPILKSLLCSVCLPFLVSRASLSFTVVFCKTPLTSKGARMVDRLPVRYFSFKLCLQDVMLGAWNPPWQEHLHYGNCKQYTSSLPFVLLA